MITRRLFSTALLCLPAVLTASGALAKGRNRQVIFQLSYPPAAGPDASGQGRVMAARPTPAQVRRATEIISNTPDGPRAIDIAQTFIDRFYDREPALISEWSAPAPHNPLIRRFLEETPMVATDDITPWCAAFVNFCIRRNGGPGSSSASSQSFLLPAFRQTDAPREGDLAVFTCFSP